MKKKVVLILLTSCFLCLFSYGQELEHENTSSVRTFLSPEDVVVMLEFRRLVEETNPFDRCGHEVWSNAYVSETLLFEVSRDGLAFLVNIEGYTTPLKIKIGGIESFSRKRHLITILRAGIYEGSSSVRNACVEDDGVEPLIVRIFFSTESEAGSFENFLNDLPET